jgi:polyferredoxin
MIPWYIIRPPNLSQQIKKKMKTMRKRRKMIKIRRKRRKLKRERRVKVSLLFIFSLVSSWDPTTIPPPPNNYNYPCYFCTKS